MTVVNDRRREPIVDVPDTMIEGAGRDWRSRIKAAMNIPQKNVPSVFSMWTDTREWQMPHGRIFQFDPIVVCPHEACWNVSPQGERDV